MPDPPTLAPWDDPAVECDVRASLLSLPALAATTAHSIPSSVPYLAADPRLVKHWGDVLSPVEGLKVGICWQGNARYQFDRCRSLPLSFFRVLAAIPGVRLISLEQGPGREQLSQLPTGSIIDLGDELDRAEGAFMDTAAIIKHLDLVISSDTSVPHLAGALAAPTWVVLPWAAEWRWFEDREDSPWYPTMRLLRQRSAGDWAELFERVAAALRSYARPS
jgi:hypothetical protein